MGDRGQLHPRLHQYRRDRRKFSIRVYLIAFVFIIITLGQWIGFKLVDEIVDFFVTEFYVGIILLFFGLLMITLFVFFESLRFATPLNWLVAILILELVTLGLLRVPIVTTLDNCLWPLVAVSFVTIIFIVIGVFIPRDLTLDVVIVFVCAIVFFVGSVFFAVIAILADMSISILIYCIFVIATVLLFLMYHSQTINGGRYAEMRLNDYLLAALIIYHDFIILYILSMFIATMIVGDNQLFNLYEGGSCGNCTTNETTTTTERTGELNALKVAARSFIKEVADVAKTKNLLPHDYRPQSYEEYQRKFDLRSLLQT